MSESRSTLGGQPLTWPGKTPTAMALGGDFDADGLLTMGPVERKEFGGEGRGGETGTCTK